VWHDHVLFVDNEVTGLIDFGAVAIDTPAVDVARLLGSLAVDDAGEWQRGLEAYATIRPFSADELRAVAALDASSTVLAGCNWIRWVFVENRQFDDREQVGRRLALLLDRLQRLVQKNASSIQ
jgi:homoserine kinase type II